MNFIKTIFIILFFFCALNIHGSAYKTKYISKQELTIVKDSLMKELAIVKKSHKDLTQQYNDLQKKLNLIDEKVNQSISRESNFISFISWASGIVISFVGVLFVIYSILMFTGNKKVINESKEALNETKKQKDVFENWFVLKKKEYKEIIRSDYLAIIKRIQNASRVERLKKLLNDKSKDAKEYYPLISALASSPLLEYKPYFIQLIELSISDEVTNMAKKGLDDISK